jgi:hypothetical protein
MCSMKIDYKSDGDGLFNYQKYFIYMVYHINQTEYYYVDRTLVGKIW